MTMDSRPKSSGMPVQRLQAAIAGFDQRQKKTGWSVYFRCRTRYRLPQRRAEAGQLQQRRVNFSGRKRSVESPDSPSNRDILDHHHRGAEHPQRTEYARHPEPNAKRVARFGVPAGSYRS